MNLRSLAAMAALALALVACSAAGSPTTKASAAPPAASASADESASPEETVTPAPGDMTSVFDLAAGDCFNANEQDVVEEVEKVPCAQLHDYELYAAFDHPAGSQDPYPGDTVMEDYAETECGDRFEAFVGVPYDESELYIFYLIPSGDTWADGDREVLCTVYLPDNQLEGSMEGSDR